MTWPARIRLALVFTACAVVLLALLPFQLLGLAVMPRLAARVPVIFHRAIVWLFGVRVRMVGTLDPSRPLLLVANHVSWLDIPVLTALAPVSFVAKAEMRSWPLFGWLARLQRTVFIARDRRRGEGGVGEQTRALADRLEAGDVMVLFPEGTTGDHNALLPFKTPLFEAARLAVEAAPQEQVMLQPLAIRYERLHGLPIGRAQRPHVAWPGTIGLGESLLPLVATGGLDVVVTVCDPIILDKTSNRKVVGAQARDAIRAALLDSPSSRS